MRRLPYHGPCFICGPDNPAGMGLDWYSAEGRIHTSFCFTASHQGPRDHTHGGATAAVLDEAMGAAAWLAGHRVLAANLSVDFRKPVPIDAVVEVEAWVVRVDGKKVFTEARLLESEAKTLLVEATGLFVSAPDFFGEPAGGWQEERARAAGRTTVSDA